MKVEPVWRYPVKSMLGEQLDEAEVRAKGLVGDRHFALVDEQTGAVAGAKQPRLWALGVLLAENRIDVPGFGVLPAAGVPATVERAGSIAVGTTVEVQAGS